MRRPVLVGPPITDAAEARLMADDDALLPQISVRGAAPFHEVFDADRLVVDRSDDQRANVLDATQLFFAKDRGCLLGIGQAQDLNGRVGPAAEEPDAADGHRHLPLVYIIAADRGIAVLDG